MPHPASRKTLTTRAIPGILPLNLDLARPTPPGLLKEVLLDSPTEINPKEYVEVLGILRTIDFLLGVDDAILKNLLFYLQKQSFPKNRQVLFRGEIANRLFIVRKGSATVSIRKDGQPVTLAELTPPNYFGEIIEWAGFALATWSLPGLAFAIYTAANVGPRALSHHRWYREKFGDYPPKRKALIPFVL